MFLKEMINKAKSSSDFSKMQKFIAPFCDYLNLSDIVYWRVTNDGKFCFIGSQISWIEHVVQNYHPADFPCIRHPNELTEGVSFMRITSNEQYRKFLLNAWNQFGLNPVISIQTKLNNAFEGFILLSKHNHDKVEEELLKELTLIHRFIQFYKNENVNLIRLIQENQVDISSRLIAVQQKPGKVFAHHEKRDVILQYYGWVPLNPLTSRELEMIHYLASGFPANFIAKKIHLSVRTVENHISNIKLKLECESKSSLIIKSKELSLIFDRRQSAM